jgi:hypothetical protein
LVRFLLFLHLNIKIEQYHELLHTFNPYLNKIL